MLVAVLVVETGVSTAASKVLQMVAWTGRWMVAPMVEKWVFLRVVSMDSNRALWMEHSVDGRTVRR